MLRENARRVYDQVIAHWNRSQYPPSIRELAAATNLSKGTTQWHVDQLVKGGWLKQDEGVSRSLRPVGMIVDLSEARRRADLPNEQRIKEDLGY